MVLQRSPMPGRRVPRTSSRHPAQSMRFTEADLGPELDDWADVDPEWPTARLVALRRDHYTCAKCGQPGSDPHHRIAKGMGGRITDPKRHAPERLITLCRGCHSWAHQNPIAAMGYGLVIQHEADATQTPVRMHYGTALLTEDGRVNTITPKLGR